eukprot:6175491-Pleurochrysis_carterae.AAC.2
MSSSSSSTCNKDSPHSSILAAKHPSMYARESSTTRQGVSKPACSRVPTFANANPRVEACRLIHGSHKAEPTLCALCATLVRMSRPGSGASPRMSACCAAPLRSVSYDCSGRQSAAHGCARQLLYLRLNSNPSGSHQNARGRNGKQLRDQAPAVLLVASKRCT